MTKEELAKQYHDRIVEQNPKAEAYDFQSAFLAGFESSESRFKEAPAYTYEQMATLNLQLQGLIDANNEEFFKLREERDYYKNQLNLIKKIIDNGQTSFISGTDAGTH